MLCSIGSLGSVGSIGRTGSIGRIGSIAVSRKYCESIPAAQSVQNEKKITIKGSIGSADNATINITRTVVRNYNPKKK